MVTSPEVQIPLVRSEPAVGDGFGAGTVSSLSPGLGTVVFPPGTSTRTTTRTFGNETPVPFYAGWLGRWGYFSLTSGGPNGEVGTPATLFVAWVAPQSTATFQFVHQRAGRGCGIRLILTHGWSITFVELFPIVSFLSDPEAHDIDGPAAVDRCGTLPAMRGPSVTYG